MKKMIFFVLVFLNICTFIFALSKNQVYTHEEDWYSGDVVGGGIQIQLLILDVYEDGAFVSITKTMTPFSQIIQASIKCSYYDGKYNFSFIDNWGNKAFRFFSESEAGLIFFLYCTEFSDSGKNLARLYGDRYLLKTNK